MNIAELESVARIIERQGDRTAPGLGYTAFELMNGGSRGVQCVTMTAGELQLLVLPTRGLSLGWAELDGIRFGWDSPVRGPIHPQFVPLGEPGGLGWLDGFDEMLVRCGLTSNGAPDFDEQGRLIHPLHGRIANLPARYWSVDIDQSQDTVTLTGAVEENRFHFSRLELQTEIQICGNDGVIRISDMVVNRSDRPAQIQLLYHANFGPPILEPGSRVHAPIKRLVPRDSHAAQDVGRWDTFDKPDPGYREQVYFTSMQSDSNGQTQAVLTDAKQQRGVALRYSTDALPCFSLWKNTVGMADGYVTGLEPATNFPNPRSFEEAQGRVVELPSGGRQEFELELELMVEANAVSQAIGRVEKLANSEAEIESQLDPNWCS